MTDYKDTLNLPKTSFPMKANLPNREPDILRKWYDEDIYGQLRAQRNGQKKYILHDGPPYANGNIHIGHVLNKTLKDIVVKSKAMQGLDTPYVPGWDCHGLPIELKVEKKLGKPGVKVSKNEFRKACREYAETQIQAQKDDFVRLGVLGSWDKPYLSMDKKVEADTIRSLARIVELGYIKKGDKPVHWCFDCQSSLAEAEVEYEMKKSPSIDVKFTVVDPKNLGLDIDLELHAVIWTTTPWSLSANQAVAVHQDFSYAVVKIDQKNAYLVAKELVESLMEKWSISDYSIIAEIVAGDLDTQLLKHPFENRQVPFIVSDHVSLDAGTGLVHTAPSHGVDDYNICAKYDLPVTNPVGPNGTYLEGTEHFAHQHVFKATTAILDVLTSFDKLVFASELEHSYPHCWRHKTPVIYRATSQWFINLEHSNLRNRTLDIVRSNQWYPSWGMSRMEKMLEGRPDWCISRQQRVWGVPMAFVIHEETGDMHPDLVNIMKKAADIVEKDGIEAWFECSLEDLGIKSNEKYIKSDDALDVWFGAGVTHECVLAKNPELEVPCDLYLEGSDQHRGWFQSSLLTSMAMHDRAPYHAVLTHGYTVDANGRKMSKSLGNVVNPDKILKTLGADILRLWVAATDYQKDVSISDEILKRISDAYRRIRNTLRYLLSNMYDFDSNKHLVDIEDMLELDKFVLKRMQNCQEQIIEDFNKYQFHHIYHRIHNFCAVELGSFYLDIIKDRQYTCQTDSKARRSCQSAIFHIAQSMVRWIAPILSFTAEEMWGHLNNEEQSVFLSTYYRLDEIKLEKFDDSYWQFIMDVRDEVNKKLEEARNNGHIGSALEAEVVLHAKSNILTKLQRIQDEIHFICITSKVSLVELSDMGVPTGIEGLRVSIESLTHKKCVRCWHRREDVGTSNEHAELCQRCIDNVYHDGEQRKIA